VSFWDDVKRGLNAPPAPPAPGSAQAERETPISVALSVDEALDAATMHMLASGYSLGSRTERSVSFVGREKPNLLIGCLLLLLFIIPAIFYFILAGRDSHATLLASPRAEGGCNLLVGGETARRSSTSSALGRRRCRCLRLLGQNHPILERLRNCPLGYYALSQPSAPMREGLCRIVDTSFREPTGRCSPAQRRLAPGL
jgi:hypothetical protein